MLSCWLDHFKTSIPQPSTLLCWITTGFQETSLDDEALQLQQMMSTGFLGFHVRILLRFRQMMSYFSSFKLYFIKERFICQECWKGIWNLSGICSSILWLKSFPPLLEATSTSSPLFFKSLDFASFTIDQSILENWFYSRFWRSWDHSEVGLLIRTPR